MFLPVLAAILELLLLVEPNIKEAIRLEPSVKNVTMNF